MKVLVLGGTGFIGNPAAKALSRAGHEVFVLTRSTAKAKELEADEISPIVGDPSDISSFKHLLSTLDALVDTVGGSADISELAIKTFRDVQTAVETEREKGQQKLTYIWTSGAWIHGDKRFEIKTESDPIRTPVKLTSWRKAVEREIVASITLNALVIRPTVLYGRSGSLFGDFFGQAHKSKGEQIVWKGTPGAILSTIHQDDLAEIYLKAVERGHLAAGLVIDATSYNEPADAILQRLAHIASDGKAENAVKYEKPTNDFEVAVQTSLVLRPTLARSLLGWEGPRKPSLVEGIQTYYRAFLASL